jgi:hypothetical protein
MLYQFEDHPYSLLEEADPKTIGPNQKDFPGSRGGNLKKMKASLWLLAISCSGQD